MMVHKTEHKWDDIKRNSIQVTYNYTKYRWLQPLEALHGVS